MELLPFLKEASQYSAVITVFLWVLVSLQLKFQGQSAAAKQSKREDEFEKIWLSRLGKVEGRITELRESLHTDMNNMELSLLREVNAIAQRVSQMEGRISRLKFQNGNLHG